MKKENAMFIADILANELKDETDNYIVYHSSWVEHLIEAMKDFYEDNDYSMHELNRLIKEYHETKEWFDNRCKED